MTLAKEIRALPLPDWHDRKAWNAALDHAAALADQHEAAAQAMVAAAYEDAATMLDGEDLSADELAKLGDWVTVWLGLAEMVKDDIRARAPADAIAAQARLIREAEARGRDAMAGLAIAALNDHFPGRLYLSNRTKVEAAILAAQHRAKEAL
jgi:hypothetical protein